jgi:hypothetical protein
LAHGAWGALEVLWLLVVCRCSHVREVGITEEVVVVALSHLVKHVGRRVDGAVATSNFSFEILSLRIELHTWSSIPRVFRRLTYSSIYVA